MKISSLELLSDVLIITPKIFHDSRGFFYESFNQKEFTQLTGITQCFVQDNRSLSVQGVVRGLHLQRPDQQGKLISVLSGEIYDVVVDLRKDSPSFGQWDSYIISSESKQQIWIPEGFAHGFQVISSQAEIFYKVTSFYKEMQQYCLQWNDPQLGITWPMPKQSILSEQDANAYSLQQIASIL